MNKSVTIKLQGREIDARFPNIGQIIKIEQYKQVLTDGRYGVMAFSGMVMTSDMLNIVDGIAYFSVIIPEFYATLGVKDSTQLLGRDYDDPIIVELVDQYRNVYSPFFNDLYKRDDRPESELQKHTSTESKEKLVSETVELSEEEISGEPEEPETEKDSSEEPAG